MSGATFAKEQKDCSSFYIIAGEIEMKCCSTKVVNEDDKMAKLEEILAEAVKSANPRSQLIEVMHKVQELYGYLEGTALRVVSERLGVPMSRIYGVVTFYHYFNLSPRSKFVISVCQGTACYVKGCLLYTSPSPRDS